MNEEINLPGFKILGLEHVAVAVKKSGPLTEFFSQLPGMNYTGSENIQNQKVITDIFSTSSGKIELLTATHGKSPIAKFLKKKGKGLHHIALKVDNICNAIAYLETADIHMIDPEPQTGAEGLLISFVHPKFTPGLLVEFCQEPQ